MKIGQYVQYKNQRGLVVGHLANGTNHVMFGNNKKYGVAERNLEALPYEAKLVEYNGDNYLVTPRLNIISLRSGRIMLWTDDMEQRQVILAKAKQ